MAGLLTKNTLIAICLAVLVEELGVPMPIPTDLLIVAAGVAAGRSIPDLALWFVLLSISSVIGASGLYAIVRRGGRPLVDRFGRYVHLGPQQLARSEALLNRFGWFGIAIGRAIPGLRYVTVIACGLLNISYRRFVTAHLVGSSVYIAVFLALGAIFGPTIEEHLHLPSLWVHLLWLLVLALGLPLLLIWFCQRAHVRRPSTPSYRRVLGAVLLASFVGTTVISATWATAATLTELMDTPHPISVTYGLARWLLGHGLRGNSAYILIYATLLLLCIAVGTLYYEVVLPRFAPQGTSLPRQVIGLALLGVGLVGGLIALGMVAELARPIFRWWQTGGPLLGLTITISILNYALTTVYGRTLAIAVLPSLWPSAPPGPPEAPTGVADAHAPPKLPEARIPSILDERAPPQG